MLLSGSEMLGALCHLRKTIENAPPDARFNVTLSVHDVETRDQLALWARLLADAYGAIKSVSWEQSCWIAPATDKVDIHVFYPPELFDGADDAIRFLEGIQGIVVRSDPTPAETA